VEELVRQENMLDIDNLI